MHGITARGPRGRVRPGRPLKCLWPEIDNVFPLADPCKVIVLVVYKYDLEVSPESYQDFRKGDLEVVGVLHTST